MMTIDAGEMTCCDKCGTPLDFSEADKGICTRCRKLMDDMWLMAVILRAGSWAAYGEDLKAMENQEIVDVVVELRDVVEERINNGL